MKRKTPPKKRLHHKVRRATKSAVIPHAHNDYRPHLIRWQGIVALALVIAFVQLGYNLVKTGSVLGQQTDISAYELLAATNRERRSQGEEPLKANIALSDAAALKADDMFKKQYWAHVSPEGTTPWQWFEQIGYSYSSAGENLAKGFHSSAGVVTAWMNSNEHRANVLSTSFSEVGFAVRSGILNGEETTVVVALYGSPKQSPVVTASAPVESVLAAQEEVISPIARLGIGIQSMTPAMLGSVALLMLATMVALVAHAYRSKLPYAWRKSWLKHHGMYKALGMVSLVVMLLALYGGGQI